MRRVEDDAFGIIGAVIWGAVWLLILAVYTIGTIVLYLPCMLIFGEPETQGTRKRIR